MTSRVFLLLGRRETCRNLRCHVRVGVVRLARYGPRRAPRLRCQPLAETRAARLGSTEVVVEYDFLTGVETDSDALAGVHVEYESLAMVVVEYDSLCLMTAAGNYDSLTSAGVAVEHHCPPAFEADWVSGVKAPGLARFARKYLEQPIP